MRKVIKAREIRNKNGWWQYVEYSTKTGKVLNILLQSIDHGTLTKLKENYEAKRRQ